MLLSGDWIAEGVSLSNVISGMADESQPDDASVWFARDVLFLAGTTPNA